MAEWPPNPGLNPLLLLLLVLAGVASKSAGNLQLCKGLKTEFLSLRFEAKMEELSIVEIC